MPSGSSAKERIAEVLRRQVAASDGSPFYAAVLGRAVDDVIAGGPCWRLLAGHEDDRFGSALPLRFLGAVQRLVLDGRAPDLAARWPPVKADIDEVWPVYVATVEEHHDTLRRLVERPVQTNEVGRCAALLGGFLLVAAETALPLRVLEGAAPGSTCGGTTTRTRGAGAGGATPRRRCGSRASTAPASRPSSRAPSSPTVAAATRLPSTPPATRGG